MNPGGPCGKQCWMFGQMKIFVPDLKFTTGAELWRIPTLWKCWTWAETMACDHQGLGGPVTVKKIASMSGYKCDLKLFMKLCVYSIIIATTLRPFPSCSGFLMGKAPILQLLYTCIALVAMGDHWRKPFGAPGATPFITPWCCSDPSTLHVCVAQVSLDLLKISPKIEYSNTVRSKTCMFEVYYPLSDRPTYSWGSKCKVGSKGENHPYPFFEPEIIAQIKIILPHIRWLNPVKSH